MEPKNHRPACRSPNRQRPAARPIFDRNLVQKMRPFSGHKIGTHAGGPTVGLPACVPILCPENGRPSLAEILTPSDSNFEPVLCAHLIGECNHRPKIMKKSVLFNNIYIKIDKNENKWINNKTIRPKVTVKIKNMCKNHVSHRIE